MRVAFDGRMISESRAGLGSYGRFVIRSLAERYPDCIFDIYFAKESNYSFLQGLKSLKNINFCYPKHSFWRWSSTLWSLFGIPGEVKRRKTDIFHGLTNFLPWNIEKVDGLKTIVTIHDLTFLFLPYSYSWFDRHLLNFIYRHSCKVSDRIVAVSECTRNDLMKYYRIYEDRISVIYQGCDQSFRICCSQSFKELVRERFGLPERFVLSVGAIDERKNAAVIVKAVKDMPDIHVVLVGARTKYTHELEELAAEYGMEYRLHILPNVNYKELPAIYQMAEIFVYPSLYEGFGVPIVEAMCCGVPVIAATGSCLEETGSDAAAYIAPDDFQGLSRRIKEILSDESLRLRMVERGFANSSKFTEKQFAESLMEEYGNLVNLQ